MMQRWLKRGLLALVLGLVGIAAAEYAVALPVRRVADVAYVPATDTAYSAERHQLDVYYPRTPGKPRPVVLFIHGGSWNSGSKNLYAFVGRRLARQGLVAVVVSYRLAPQVRVPQMADDCARAVAWTVRHIAQYGGDAGRVVVMGHSAGGGLAALLAADAALLQRWGVPPGTIKGALLDDPAGLDMYDYLQKLEYPGDEEYLVPFGRNPAVWRQTSALYHLTPQAPPFVLLIGGRTYPSIQRSSQVFRERLTALGHPPRYTMLPGKKHIPMVLQLYWPRNVVYRQLQELVAAH